MIRRLRFDTLTIFALIFSVLFALAPEASQPASTTPPSAQEIIFYPTYGYRDGADWVIPLRAKAQLPVTTSLMTGTIKTRLADFFARDTAGQEIRVRFDADTSLMDYRISVGAGTFPPTDVNGNIEGTIRMADSAAQRLLSSSTDGWLTFRDMTAGTPGRGASG